MNNSPHEDFLTPTSSCSKSKRVCLIWLSAAALALLLAVYIVPSFLQPTTTVSVAGGDEALQKRIDNLENRLHSLEEKAASTPTATTTEPSAPTAALEANAGNLEHLQNDMTALSSAMAALQTEVKATSATETEAREASTGLIASVVGYVQLHETVATSRPFVAELADMREAAHANPDLLALLATIEPYAASGTSTVSALRDELLQRQPAVAVAVAKGSAQHWWQRLWASLQGLITVRPIHGGEGDALAALEAALESGSAADALAAFKELPADAQSNLADWQKRLEARQHADEALNNLAHYFTGLGKVKNP